MTATTKRLLTLTTCTVIGLTVLTAPLAADAETVLFDGAKTAAAVIHDDTGLGRTGALAAGMLSGDLKALSGTAPTVSTRANACPQVCVVIGLYTAPQIRRLAAEGGIDLADLTGQWEVYRRAVVHTKDRTYLLIAGSDVRGTVYGVVDLSRQLGISPWEWWADVTPRHADRLAIDDATVTSKPPSVQYRGIFLNDEDWGLEPWAAKTFDPATGNIGPKTYARVFELMWRLKANTLWPAMHSVSTPFYGNPGNAPLAHDYAIIVGTSHAEPMMRNNLREWDETKKGAFDFTKNRPAILDYWRQRVAAVKPYENIYTVGLRGIHDGPMQGASTMAQRQDILQNVIGLQRRILSDVYRKPAASIPQVYVAYHELEEAYDAGLKIPDDVTLMWADDNYGYIRRFSTPDEAKRPGGSGVYYHLSYWGRPHDYLWLGTTHPALIHEEMDKAWDMQARRMWIANVGDIKPMEFLTQYFLDLAFDHDRFKDTPRAALTGFMREQFGPDQSAEIADIMLGYYDLAFERRPEFMGFGQTEWVTQNRHTAYVSGDGEEAQRRITAYQALVTRAEAVAATLPADRRDAFFELVLYPVRAAAGLNTRILKLDLADLYAEQGRASANLYVGEARAAHQALVADTATFNQLQNGKWKEMMDMAPRRLPVFDEPLWPQWSASTKTGCDLALTGQWINDENTLVFVSGRPQSQPVTLFGYRPAPAAWSLDHGEPGLNLSAASGNLSADDRFESRLTLAYDGKGAVGDHNLIVTCDGIKQVVHTRVLPALPDGMTGEDNRIVALSPAAGTLGGDWQTIDGLGSLGKVVRARLDLPSRTDATGVTPATYAFATASAVGGVLKIVALPTHPLDPTKGLRVAVQLDDGAVTVLDLATSGRSDAWRDNVLTNTAIGTVAFKMVPDGRHVLRVFALDPGVTLDRIELDLDRAPTHYGAVAQGASAGG